jgi:hypothetical protein|tara:strand:+ start:4479 stop:5891 length:1413 start_codon:yes stop_codon:yes gene_type:complete
MATVPSTSNPMFFYDDQIRRFLLQFTRIFSNFQVEYGRNEEGTAHTLVRVPIRYGDSSRQVQTIIQNNSANSMPSVPMMSFYISGLDYDRPRMQEPYFVNKIAVRQRTYDDNTQTYDSTQGNAFTIERLMPVPYKLTLKLDIWTSNTNQKMQLLEQIVVLFNPALEIQSTDNYIDWTSLSIVQLESTQWTSRSVPVGTDDNIDVATMTFSLPIWISSPAKVKKLGVVERIIMNIYDANGDAANAVFDNDLLLGTRMVVTPWDYQTLLIGNKLQALRQSAVVDEPNSSLTPADSPQSNLLWTSLISAYGVLRPGISQIFLEQEDESEVAGTIAYDPSDDRFMLYSIDEDTKPQNTLSPVRSVIDPLRSGPDAGLPVAAEGQRYLLTEATGSESGHAAAWAGILGQPLIAKANDIIEYIDGRWQIVFDNTSSPDNLQYVTNITTAIQYKWTGATWIKSYQGLYPGGKWRIVL